MMNKGPLSIVDTNLSCAWARAFQEVVQPGASEINLLTVVVKDFVDEPPELLSIRNGLDEAMRAHRNFDCHTVANTIFPISLWNSKLERQALYKRYLRILPDLRHSNHQNRYGLYFERLIAFDEKQRFNQLEHIISTYQRGNHRRSALHAMVFNPLTDHTHQRQRGFPCLQHVNFLPHKGELEVVGFYTTQHLFERAYGNYLGLCRLGRFMAHEMGLRLTKMTCIATVAQLGHAPRHNLDQLIHEMTVDIQPTHSPSAQPMIQQGVPDGDTRQVIRV
jgi:thymidylate synthase